MRCHAPDDFAAGFLREDVQVVVEDLRRWRHLRIATARNGVEGKASRPRSMGTMYEVARACDGENVEIAVGSNGGKHVFSHSSRASVGPMAG